MLRGGVCRLEELVGIIVRLFGERTAPRRPNTQMLPDEPSLSWTERAPKQLLLKAGVHVREGGSDTAFSISLLHGCQP